MIRRTHSAAFMGGAHVFPAAASIAADAAAELAACCEGMDDIEASRLLGLEQGGLAYWAAACASASRKPACCSPMTRAAHTPI